MYSDIDKYAIHIMGDQGVALFGEFGTENDASEYFEHFLKKTVEKVHGSYTVEFIRLTMISRLEMADPDDESIFVQNEDGNKYRMDSAHYLKPKLTLV
tara:strand:+ start:523 stop:816 length:294 start_codon:yes stop_codon:yes gene_type:complete